ncbi:MAG: ABC transporter ATP-binding protein [Planctomycetota bacterium]|nr:ABC transporter ATP-binding protein [Planctomycetota bacterium]
MELEFKDVSFEYGGDANDRGLRALDGVDGYLRRGELVAVLGPNGAGKSTLVRLLAGLAQPLGGSVHLAGKPLERLGHRERAREVALVPQHLDRVPEMHVGDFVLGGRYAHLGPWRKHTAADHAATEAAFRGCDIEGLEGRLLSTLSGGQRQRALIARALAQESPILLVDEPTNSLDPRHQLAIFELLADLAAADRAVLVVTHDLNLASQFATRLVLMDEGRIVAQGPAEVVLRREVLEPVYGDGLTYGELDAAGGLRRPFVLPWRAGQSPSSGPRPASLDAEF